MAEGKSIFIDTTKCIACRGCQIACKQWNQLGTEKTHNRGGRQNPPDMSVNTWKLVKFRESPTDKRPLSFFPDQCRHCLIPLCKEIADMENKNLITLDEKTGAVVFTQKTKLKPEAFEEIREACPYDIPRYNSNSMHMAKCTMCISRIKNESIPACVKTCATGAMHFGDRDDILEKAYKRLEEVKSAYKNAILADPEDVRVIYLFTGTSQLLLGKKRNRDEISRRIALKQISQPLRFIRNMLGQFPG